MVSHSEERRIAATAAVPLLLALLSAIQLATSRHLTDFLILPPFAVIIYLIFRSPRAHCATVRSVVLLPCVGAIIGQVSWHYLGMTPAGVAAATFLTLLAQAALRADMPPAFALAVLAMLLHATGPWYVLGVLQGTVLIFIVFRLWRAFGPAGWR